MVDGFVCVLDPLRYLGDINGNFLGGGGLFSHRRGHGCRNIIDFIDNFGDLINFNHCRLSCFLDFFDLSFDIVGGIRCLLCQSLDFIGNNGKPFASLSGSGCLNRGVKGQQVGLL